MKSINLVLIFITALTLGVGCGKETPTETKSVLSSLTEETMPDEAEAEAFAEAFQTAVSSADSGQVNRLINWDDLLNRAIGNVECNPKLRDQFAQGVMQSARTRGLATELCAAIEAGGSYKLLRLHKTETEQRALFRLLLPDGAGVNYHDLILARDKRNQVRAADIYIFLSAETMSTTFRRAFLPVAAQSEKSLLERLTTKENVFVKNIGRLAEMTEKTKSNDPEKALEIYRELPASLQQDKLYLLLRLQAASLLDEKTYEEAIDAFRTAHPDDAGIDLVSVDGFILKQDFKGAMDCLDRLQTAVGNDAYISVLKANIHAEMDAFDDGIRLCREAIEVEPELEDAYWTLVTCAIRSEDWDAVASTLRSLETRFAIEFENLEELELYQPFTRTPQYQKWLQRKSADTSLNL